MPTYSGSFPLVAQGAAVTVTLDGVVQSDPAPGVVGSTVRHGSLPYSYVYEAGDDDTSLLATVTTSAGILSTELILDQTASIASGGGGASETGDGPPSADPAGAGVGAQYVDTFSGALYIVTNFDDTPEWSIVGGEINGENDFQGVILGNGIVVAGKSLSGDQVTITDVDAYNNSGNGFIWRGAGGGDGAQSARIKAGSGGITFTVNNPGAPHTAWQAYNDGSSEFGGVVYFDQNINITAQAAPADVDVNPGQVFVYFDATNGAAKIRFKGKSADGTLVAGNVALS